MSTKSSWMTLKFRGVVDVIRASRFQLSHGGGFKRNTPIVTVSKVGNSYWMQPGIQFFSTKRNTSTHANRLKNDEAQPEAPDSKIFAFTSWVKWVLCSLLSFMLPFWRQNWAKLQRIEEEAEFVIEEAEKVAEVIEKVAEEAEKVSENIAEKLPEDAKLKKAALVVENVSKQVAHDAQITEQFIHKIEEVADDIEDLESFVERVIDKIVKKKDTGKN
ncbi:uncharacterized protein LOC131634054 isoform X1 [Vicia villosa]|uniref:uncharacterized protein LOC131634054 isoform X1 n=1 Tax=Vicia villosa TaxID=3911 RepID=UPI00273BD668|nr:uncharacterized protein LOC131634054 isoform X1 [Vicia villosa]